MYNINFISPNVLAIIFRKISAMRTAQPRPAERAVPPRHGKFPFMHPMQILPHAREKVKGKR